MAVPTMKSRCARCRHARTFHQNADNKPCRATGCHVSAGKPCTGFVAPFEPAPPVAEPVVLRSPFEVIFREPVPLSHTA